MTAILVIAGIVGLVWGTWLCLRGSLIAGCLTYLVMASCFGAYFLQFDAGGVTLSLDRLFLVALAITFVVQWRLGKTDPKPMTRVDYLLLGLVGVLIVSTFTHDWRAAEPNRVPVVQHLINGYLIPLAVYWIARQATLTQRNVTMILIALTGMGVYLAATGLAEAAGQWSLVFPRYIADPEVGTHFGRARGPMVQSICYGLYLASCLLAAWLWRERLARHGKLLIVLMVPAFLAAIFFTNTRSVWLGAATGLFVVLAVTLRGRVRVAVLGSLVVAGLLAGVTKMDAFMGLKRGGTAADTRTSNSMRASFAYVSWKMFQDRPLLGFGFGHFAEEKLPYLTDRSVDLHLENIRPWVHHNTFLSVLTETGLVGFTLFLGVYLGWGHAAVTLVRAERAPPWVRRHGALMLGVLAVAF